MGEAKRRGDFETRKKEAQARGRYLGSLPKGVGRLGALLAAAGRIAGLGPRSLRRPR